MSKSEKTPAGVLHSLINEYQTNPFALSKSTHIDYQSIRKILSGKGKISTPAAIKLSRYFGQSPAYFMDIQLAADIIELGNNKTFVKQLNSIKKAQKPAEKSSVKTAPASAGRRTKTNTLSAKRKKAAKVPGARGTKRKRTT